MDDVKKDKLSVEDMKIISGGTAQLKSSDLIKSTYHNIALGCGTQGCAHIN